MDVGNFWTLLAWVGVFLALGLFGFLGWRPWKK